MDNQKIIVESLAMDLKRVALGLHRGSITMANRFKEEAFKRTAELEQQRTDAYLSKLVKGMKNRLSRDSDRVAEDALMYSTLFQNYAIKIL